MWVFVIGGIVALAILVSICGGDASGKDTAAQRAGNKSNDAQKGVTTRPARAGSVAERSQVKQVRMAELLHTQRERYLTLHPEMRPAYESNTNALHKE